MIVKPDDSQILKAAKLLKDGGLVGMPTETVYGLAADCFNDKAVKSIFELKNRPATDPLIIHISNTQHLNAVAVISIEHQNLLDKLAHFWPGPLTVILPKSKKVPNIVSAGLETVAVRMPRHPVALRLIELSGPLAAPSANISTRVSPTCAQHVFDEFAENLPIILDGGNCEIGLESTILDISNYKSPRILRPGGITFEELIKIIPNLAEVNLFKKSSELQSSPGQMIEHYCPNTPLKYLSSYNNSNRQNIGLISLSADLKFDFEVNVHKKLSLNSSLEDAAHNLFASIRELDKMGLDVILIEEVPRDGIGRAIMDRLDRATARFRNN